MCLAPAGTALLSLLLVVHGTEAFDLVILHTNDVHAHYEQFNKYGSACNEKDAAAGKCFGGYARRATVIKQIRAEEDHVILLSGGDWSQGTVWYYAFQGTAAALLMSHLNYTAAGIGNHEYDKGIPVFVDKFLKRITFPALSANTDASLEPSMQGLFSKSTVITLGGRQIGIIGYTTSLMHELSLSYGNLRFGAEVPAVQQEARRLKQSGVDILIAVGHSGLPTDTAIAEAVPEIDVVVGGHDNTFMWNGPAPSEPELPESPYPKVVQQAGGRRVPVLVVQDFMFGKYLGKLKVTFDSSGEVTSYHGNPILLNSSYPEDNETLAVMDPFLKNLTIIKNQTIGQSLIALPIVWNDKGRIKKCRIQECVLGNLVADSLVYKNLVQPEGVAWAKVSLGVWNSGGIRAGINVDEPRTGRITNVHILEAVPFDNEVVIITIRGNVIYEMFENSVSRIEDEKGRFLQVSGFKVTYNIRQPVGSRVVSVLARCSNCSTPHFEPLDANRYYQILISSFIAGGGDGFTMLRDKLVDMKPLGFVDSDMVREYIVDRQPIYQGEEGRIEFLDADVSSSGKPAFSFTALIVLCILTLYLQ